MTSMSGLCMPNYQSLVLEMLERGRRCSAEIIEDILTTSGGSSIEERDADDRTPLMIACTYGRVDLVELLLKYGADLNATCRELGNTPLHYACISVGYWRGYSDERKAIVRYLLEHGAVYKANLLGLIPVCYAGLHRFEGLVDLFAGLESLEDQIGEKVKGLEFLSVSYATGFPTDMSLAHKYLLEAMHLRLNAVSSSRSASSSAKIERCEIILTCFARSECDSLDTLEAIKGHDHEIQMEAILIGARICPLALDLNYFWKYVLEFAYDCISEDHDMALGSKLFSFFLSHKELLEMMLEKILSKMNWAISRRLRNDPDSDVTEMINDIMEHFLHMITEQKCRMLEEANEPVLHRFLARTIIVAASSRWDRFQKLSSTLISIMRAFHINSISSSPNYSGPFQISLEIIDNITSDYLGSLDSLECHNLGRLLPILLQEEDATFTGTCEKRTMLHMIASNMGQGHGIYMMTHRLEVAFEFVLRVTRMIIRHGCPIDARTANYMYQHTARDIALLYTEHIKLPFKAKFLELLSKSNMVRLKELAAITVLKWKLPYRKILIAPAFIAGEDIEPLY